MSVAKQGLVLCETIERGGLGVLDPAMGLLVVADLAGALPTNSREAE